jgi:hypothetical protein
MRRQARRVHASTLSANAQADTAIANPMQVQASAFSISSLQGGQVQASSSFARSMQGGQVHPSAFDSSMRRQRVQAQAHSVAQARPIAQARFQSVPFVR